MCVPGCPVQPDSLSETILYLLYQVAGQRGLAEDEFFVDLIGPELEDIEAETSLDG